MLISVVVPLYNESEGIETFHSKHLAPALKKQTGLSFEVIYVNDGSSDDTLSKVHKIAKEDLSVRVINLSRNFGKEIATTAGIFHANGDALVIMDGDGQHPPEKIGEFIAHWQKGAQVVVGIRSSNEKEGVVKKYGSKLFYKLFNATAGHEIIPRSTDYRLIDKVVQQEFISFDERNRITRGLIDWLGFDKEYVVFQSPERIAGSASYSINQLFKLAFNSFVSLSLRPLFLVGWAGAFITLASLILGISVFIEQFILGDPLKLNITGSALLWIFISFLVGIVLVSQGIIAVYLSHVHGQTQARPLFVINPKGSIKVNEERKKATKKRS